MVRTDVGAQTLLNSYWVAINLQTTALSTIVVPAALAGMTGKGATIALAQLASVVALAAMVVTPWAGAASDRRRRRGVKRRGTVLAGAGIDLLGLVWLATARSPLELSAGVIVATIGISVSVAAYEALIPEVVDRSAWGAAAGYRGATSLIGTAAGLGIAALFPSGVAIGAMVVTVAAGALSVLATTEPYEAPVDHELPGVIRDRRDFAFTFVGRFWVVFGITLLMTFVLYFFKNVLHAANPAAGAGLVAAIAMIGAIGSSLWMGFASDRTSRKATVIVSTLPMAATALAFGIWQQQGAVLLFAVIFGLGYGAFRSTDWALAIDSLPKLRDAGRDLGILGIASGLPGVLAPVFGGWLITRFTSPADGYRALFIASAGSFVLGAISVGFVGAGARRSTRRRALSPAWAVPLRLAIALLLWPSLAVAYRIRGWGRLPWRRRETLVVSNHQHDLDSVAVVHRLTLQGPWRHPVFAAVSRREFEPGFMAVRAPWLAWALRRLDPGPFFRTVLGMRPIENTPLGRPLTSMAHDLRRRWGNLRLGEVLTEAALARLGADPNRPVEALWDAEVFPAASRPTSMLSLREPYRSELRTASLQRIRRDLDDLEDLLAYPVTLFLMPEGGYTPTGAIRRFRAALDRLRPRAPLWLAPIAYDPFAAGRLSLLYRIVPAPRRVQLRTALLAARPITLSNLVGELLHQRDSFTGEWLAAELARALEALPAGAFVDPRLRRNPSAALARALAAMVRSGLLAPEVRSRADCLPWRRRSRRAWICSRYRVVSCQVRWFQDVEDMFVYQATALRETLAAIDEHAGGTA